MQQSRYSNNQILTILIQNENGISVSKLCREHCICSAKFYKWRAKFDGMDASLMKWKRMITHKRWSLWLFYLYLWNAQELA